MAQGTLHVASAHGAWHKAQGTWHVARGTQHMAQGTWHMAQGTWHVARGTWHMAHGTGYMAQGTWHTAHGTGHMAHGTEHMAHGIEHVAHGTGHRAHGAWHVAHGTGHMAHGTWHVAHGTWHTAHGTKHMAQGTQHVAHGTWHTAHGTPARHTAQPPPSSKGVSRLSPRLPSRVLLDIKALGKLNCLQSTVCASALCLLWENTSPPRLCGCAILLSFPRNACSKAAAAPRCRDQPKCRRAASIKAPPIPLPRAAGRERKRVVCQGGCSAFHPASPPLWRAWG